MTITYAVWRRHHQPGSEWSLTAETLRARSDRDAQARLRRRFKNAGFSSMSLLALPSGTTPKDSAL